MGPSWRGRSQQGLECWIQDGRDQQASGQGETCDAPCDAPCRVHLSRCAQGRLGRPGSPNREANPRPSLHKGSAAAGKLKRARERRLAERHRWKRCDAAVIRCHHAAGVAKRLRQRLVAPPFGGSIPLARPLATDPPQVMGPGCFFLPDLPAQLARRGSCANGAQGDSARHRCRRLESRASPPSRTGSWQGNPVRAAVSSRAADA